MIEIVVGMVAAWLMADFFSGFWHWIEDRYFDDQWPIIGQYISKPNTLHHAQPAAFLQQGYWSRNWTTMVPCAVLVAVALPLRAPWWSLLSIACLSQANEVHAWAHRRVGNRFIRGLQEFGLCQSPRHHMQHHSDPYSSRYCVMTDWLNPLLDRSRFWFALEWALERFGIPIHPDCREMDQRTSAAITTRRVSEGSALKE